MHYSALLFCYSVSSKKKLMPIHSQSLHILKRLKGLHSKRRSMELSIQKPISIEDSKTKEVSFQTLQVEMDKLKITTRQRFKQLEEIGQEIARNNIRTDELQQRIAKLQTIVNIHESALHNISSTVFLQQLMKKYHEFTPKSFKRWLNVANVETDIDLIQNRTITKQRVRKEFAKEPTLKKEKYKQDVEYFIGKVFESSEVLSFKDSDRERKE